MLQTRKGSVYTSPRWSRSQELFAHSGRKYYSIFFFNNAFIYTFFIQCGAEEAAPRIAELSAFKPATTEHLRHQTTTNTLGSARLGSVARSSAMPRASPSDASKSASFLPHDRHHTFAGVAAEGGGHGAVQWAEPLPPVAVQHVRLWGRVVVV